MAGRQVPIMIEPGFDELQADDLDGAPSAACWSWKHQHTTEQQSPGS